MSACIERNINFLKALREASPYKRKKLIEKATADNILALEEIAHNILKGNFRLTDQVKEKLKRYKSAIRKLIKLKASLKLKKILIGRNSGFLPHIISPILSVIGSVAGAVAVKSLGI